MTEDQAPIVLASASEARAIVLRRAGIPFEVMPPRIDEEREKETLREQGIDGVSLAEALAERKALSVGEDVAPRLVLAADQVLDHGEGVYDKPTNREEACCQLRALRGKAHELVSAACLAEGRDVVWHHTARARLWVRPFSDDFLEGYLDAIGPAAFSSPGSYRVEGLGIQLFERIEGDHATILGLPLLPLLAALRARGVMPT